MSEQVISESLRVLLVEDSATDAKLVIQALCRSGLNVEFRRVEEAAAMRAALDAEVWDCVISDWSMPTFSAAAALRVLREKQLDLPFIIVSGTIGEDCAVDAMRTGAHDYVLKDKLGRLLPAVERELRECQDRRARRQAEHALRESETRFRRLAESGIIGITIVDLGGRILDANEGYLRMVGYAHDELVAGAMRWQDLTPPDCVPLAAAAAEQLRRSGFASPWEADVFRKDGSRAPMLVGAAMLDQSRYISFSVDLSARNQAEAGRIRAERALSEREEQLRQAQKMDAVGRLAGGVAHDFNNMLSVILSYGELLLNDLAPGSPMRADLEEIRKAAARAAGLTQQLLMFSRQQVVEPKVIDLGEVLASMAKMLQRILGEDIELKFSAPQSGARVKVDPSHIEQVILNLVVNARDAMPTGGRLSVETANVVLDESYVLTHPAATAGPHVMMTVSDTGCGMSRDTQARIFEPFFTTKEHGKGTGLGLSTVFGIVQQSGGTVWVDSEPGKGTTFKVYLPRADAELDLLSPQLTPVTLQGAETILLVEDEEQVRAIVLNILRRQGYHILAAEGPEQALLTSERETAPIDLLLTDVVMPQMSGPELAKRLSAVRPALKVLYMSGYSDDSIARHGIEDSAGAFIQKPFTPASIARKVREVLDRAPGPAHIAARSNAWPR